MRIGSALQQSVPFASAQMSADMACLRIMETTDLHVHLAPYDYYADRPRHDLGLLPLSRLVDQARRETPNTLLFDNGDFLQGTPVGDFVAYERGLREGDLHPVMAAMNALGFDAITLGNHEFNYGLGFLMKAIARSDCPVVAANLLRKRGATARGDRSLTRPYALLDRVVCDMQGQPHPLRVGVIGLAPPQVVNWEHSALDGRVWSRDIVETARAWIPEMREAGADIVIALAHSGVGAARHSDGMENAILPLARLDGIDVVLAGHSHLEFPGPAFAPSPEVDPAAGTICGKPAVMAGFWGSHLGVIDLLLRREGRNWTIMGSRSELRALASKPSGPRAPALTDPVPGFTPPRPRSPGVRRIVAQTHQDTLAAIRKPIGQAATPLHSYFALLGRSAATAVVADAQCAYITERLRGTEHGHLPVIAAVAPFKAGGRSGAQHYTDIAPGPLALRHVSDLYAYPNMVAALRLTGAQVRLWLERSASVFSQVVPGGAPRVLTEPEAAPYQFDILYGLDYVLDLAQPARFLPGRAGENADASRVLRVRLNGKPLLEDDEVILCTNNFRASGAGGFAGPRTEQQVFGDSTSMLGILRDHIATHPRLVPQHGPPLRFAPIPQGRAILPTGPGARAHLHDIADLNPGVLDDCGAGFLNLLLDFDARA